MEMITQTPTSGNVPPPLEPYDAMMARQLISAIKHLQELLRKGKGDWFSLPLPDNSYRFPKRWAAGGRLPLDCDGRAFLRKLGINAHDLRRALNEGVRSGTIERVTTNGVAYIGLKGARP